eukprot:683476-Amphidinium_carterae.1
MKVADVPLPGTKSAACLRVSSCSPSASSTHDAETRCQRPTNHPGIPTCCNEEPLALARSCYDTDKYASSYSTLLVYTWSMARYGNQNSTGWDAASTRLRLAHLYFHLLHNDEDQLVERVHQAILEQHETPAMPCLRASRIVCNSTSSSAGWNGPGPESSPLQEQLYDGTTANVL